MQAPAPPVHPAEPVQRVVKIRRDYNAWVASETLEDHALRFTPRGSRRWSGLQVANMAFGASSFLVLEAVGATLLVEYGFINALWAILATGLIILLAGWPISVYAARYGLDMDLLTRGAGFGYIGSTLTSLIYASFTFIFFALEAAIMAYALELAFDIPPAWGYLICALLVLPMVTHGVTIIARLQAWTQPLWLFLLILPYVYVFSAHPGIAAEISRYAGVHGTGGTFDLKLFGAAMTVGIALITQMGEQADYLRFMPEPVAGKKWRWWAAVFVGGPGWVIPGVLKMLGGALLAYLALQIMVPAERVVDPNQMYLVAFDHVFSRPSWSVAATALLVIVSQLKINVTNAYAGSLAWSNFFARLTHSHPGRVVWVVFNTAIALLLMEMELLSALGRVLGLFSNIAIAWIMSVVADLVINKPLGFSPPGIEFKRAHLYDINPVGVGAMAVASLLSVSAHLGVFGEMAQAFSALIALVTALVCSPLIAWATKGRYYIARPVEQEHRRAQFCCICEREYEGPDMAHCPAYKGPICSLCCSLDARCDDLCKPQARLSQQAMALMRRVTPRRLWPLLEGGLLQYLGLALVAAPLLLLFFGLLHRYGLLRFTAAGAWGLTLLAGVMLWWLVLTHKSREVAQEETRRQSQALLAEIESHRRTDAQLQQAKLHADAANQAKTRYITTISHELRTPLNAILGYAQILDGDSGVPPHRQQAVKVIRRGGEHLLSLIDASLDLARIESGRLKVEAAPFSPATLMDDLSRLLAPQAMARSLTFDCLPDELPAWVRGDAKRLQQILTNLLGNAIKFSTTGGRVRLAAHYSREMARFEIEDNGPGMSAEDLSKVFEPFERGAGAAHASGTGLGLTIARSLTELMGGEMKVSSQPGQGTRFELLFFLPRCEPGRVREQRVRKQLAGPPRRLLVVDNEEADRELMRRLLEPLGFELRIAAGGEEALQALQDFDAEALLLDLAMPGMDGWQTLAAIRERGLSQAPAVIISANAFDREAGDHDFILKPLRLDELLDWLEAHLHLRWQAPPPTEAAEALPDAPSRERLLVLQRQLSLGHVKGVREALDAMADEAPALTAQLRGLALEFQMQALGHQVAQALQATVHEPTPGST